MHQLINLLKIINNYFIDYMIISRQAEDVFSFIEQKGGFMSNKSQIKKCFIQYVGSLEKQNNLFKQSFRLIKQFIHNNFQECLHHIGESIETYLSKNYPQTIINKNQNELIKQVQSMISSLKQKLNSFIDQSFHILDTFQNIQYNGEKSQLVIKSSPSYEKIYLNPLLMNYHNLKSLIYKNSNLNDESLTSIAQNCKNLQQLNLSGNNLTDKFVDYLRVLLNQIVLFDVSFNNVTDQGVKNLVKQLHNCQTIDLSYTNITQKGVQSLLKLRKIKDIKIWSGVNYPHKYYENIIGNEQMNYHKYLKCKLSLQKANIEQLKSVKLESIFLNQQRDVSEIISSMSDQIVMCAFGSKLNTKCLEKIFKSKALKSITNLECSSSLIKCIQFIKCDIKNIHELFSGLKYVTELDILNLADCNITTHTAVEISKTFTNLTVLNLSQNLIQEEGVIKIALNLTSLRHLDLSNNLHSTHINNVGKYGAIEIARNLKQLKHLNLAYNNIGSQAVIELAKRLTNLQHLNLEENYINKEGALQIAKNLKNLIYLNLANNNVGKQGAIQIARNLKKLKNLNLYDNYVGKEAAIEIAKSLKQLNTLNLFDNYVGQQAAIQIAQNLKNLTILNLGSNDLMTNDDYIGKEGALQIARHLKNLTNLNLCANRVSNEGAIEIVKNLKNLMSLNLKSNNINKESQDIIKHVMAGKTIYI